MKQFNYSNYLKNNPLLKESLGLDTQEISTFLSKFREPSKDNYKVSLYYNDYPSISNSDMKHASQVFIATTQACGGMTKRIGGTESDQIFMVQGCPIDNLMQAWEYLGDYNKGFSANDLAGDDDSESLRSVRGTAGSWKIDMIK